MPEKPNTNFKIDLALIILYPIVVALGFYGASLDPDELFLWHESFALALICLLGVHLSLHWNWVMSMIKKLFGPMPPGARHKFIVNLLLIVAFAVMFISGVLISDLFNIGLRSNETIVGLHHLFAKITIALFVWHLLLHLKWLIRQFKKK